MEALVKGLPSGAPPHATVIAAVKRWMLQHVTFHYTAIPTSPLIRGSEMRSRFDQLEFEDRFFGTKRGRGRQLSLLMFELGKVLWLRMDPTLNTQPMSAEQEAAASQIRRLIGSNHSVMFQLKRTPYEQADLGDLVDGADAASPFGYALRAVMLGLEPADPGARATWRRIRPELERAIAVLVAR